jgi:hypothetical protein
MGDDHALERYLREGGSTVQAITTSATGTLIPGTNTINKATGSNVYLLPPATGSQSLVRVVIGTTITSGSCIIKTATNADFMVGMMTFGTTTFAAGSTEALGGTDALITLVAASGGVKGTVITFTDIAANLWLVDGILAATTAASVVGAWA